MSGHRGGAPAPQGPPAAADAVVDVAVGVVFRDDGAVLLGQRLAGKPYAGWWEFPGGKLEAGESVAQALARELDEELGIRVLASHPWIVREFVYPHARVRLHFRRVTGYRGEPVAREGQAFAWRSADRVDLAPLLPATVPVIAWLRLPALCLRPDFDRRGDEQGLRDLECALRALCAAPPSWPLSAPVVLLGEPSLAPSRFERLFYRVRAICAAHGVRLLVSDEHPASFARAADGAIVRRAALADGRPAGPLAAARCASAADLACAARSGFDFALADRACLPAIADGAPLPVVLEEPPGTATLRARIDAAWHAGAHGVAVALPLWQDADSAGRMSRDDGAI